ncbi:TPA: hypothetical protein ACFN9X_001706, partial [Neisseria meningitidis]
MVYLTGAQSALSFTEQADWIPAYSGMTGCRFLFLVFYPCGNDENLSFRNLSEKTETALPS